MKTEIVYNKTTDTLHIWFRNNRPAISEDCDGEFWLRRDPKTKEILGIEIEDFRKIFLKKHLGTNAICSFEGYKP